MGGMKSFFTASDPLDAIIHTTLSTEKVIRTRHVLTGWTNIVIEVTTNQGGYFFRFPRNPFWSKMIIKDSAFCNFIDGKTSFYTPSMAIHYHNDRPFSVHPKIDGYSLNDRIYHLSHTTLTAAAYSIAKFIKELGNIDPKSAPKEVKYPLSDFLRELDTLHFDQHLNADHAYIKAREKPSPRLVHGDLNLGNILLDKDDNVIAVIDFCFAGTGHPHMDLSRIVSRPVPAAFESALLSSYATLSDQPLDIPQITRMRHIWGNIDQGYIGHIKRAHPEITLPSNS
jgi:aminoglycoside phosphotransferase (APT) family kinase protein